MRRSPAAGLYVLASVVAVYLGAAAACSSTMQQTTEPDEPTLPILPKIEKCKRTPDPHPDPGVDPADRCLAAPDEGVGEVISIAAGWRHTCALTMAGRVFCWGGDAGRTRPNRVVASTEGAISLVAGGRGTCVLTADGGPRCWSGDSEVGPVRGLDGGVTAIAMGGGAEATSTCALVEPGDPVCWGAVAVGPAFGPAPAGGGPPEWKASPAAAVAIAVGAHHACTVGHEGRVACWGANDHGQLGRGEIGGRFGPAEVGGLADVVSLAAGEAHTCALTRAGSVLCWGANGAGQLGRGPEQGGRSPAPIPALSEPAVAVAAGSRHTCAITRDGGLHCWGAHGLADDPAAGQPGVVGGGVPYSDLAPWEPRPVPGLARGVLMVAAGAAHTCALGEGGKVGCWGANDAGQLGNGTLEPAAGPLPVAWPVTPE